MNTLLLIFLAPFLTSTAVGQVESVQIQSSFFETTALKFYCRYGSVLNEDVSGCTPKTVVQEQPQQTVQEKVVEVVRNVFVPVASAQEPSDSYLESMIRRIVLELLPTPQTIVVKGEKGDKGDPGTSGSNLLAFDGIQMPFWSGYGSGPTGGGATVVNNVTNIFGSSSTSTVTANNGLTINPANNVQLGGLLVQDTLIDLGTTTLSFNQTSTSSRFKISGASGYSAGFSTQDIFQIETYANEGFAISSYETGPLVTDPHGTFLNFTSNLASPLGDPLGTYIYSDRTTGTIAMGRFAGGAISLDTSGVDILSEDVITAIAGSVQGFFANDNNLLVPGDAGFRFRTLNAASNDIAVANFDPGVGLGVNMFVGQFDPNTQFTGDPGDFYFNMSPVDDNDIMWVKGPTGGFGSNTGWVPVQTGTSSAVTAWLLTGNSGTDPLNNFVGTVDAQDLVLRTNNSEVARFGQVNNFSFGYGAQALSSNMNVMGNNAGTAANNAPNSNFFGIEAGASATNASTANFFGFYAGNNATNAATSNFIGASAGNGATNAATSNFIGDSAGFNATDATFSNFIGYRAGFVSPNASNSNFIGNEAGNGATDASNANFFGQMAGLGALNAQASNFIGFRSGLNATNAYRSNFFGYFAGQDATNANNSNFFGESAGQDATNANNSNFFGTSAGQNAATADNSNFFGNGAGLGAVDAFNSNFFGQESGYLASNAPNSNFFGHSAGYQATNADASNFLGQDAGYQATNANHSNFFGTSAGQSATDASDANFFGQNAGNGALSAVGSNFFGPDAGSSATNASRSNFFGDSAGQNSVNASYSNFLGYRAGENAPNAANSIFIGQRAGFNDVVNNTVSGTSILIGDDTSTGGFSNSIVLGANATNTASNQLYIRDAITNFNLAGVNYNFPTTQGATGTVLTNNGTGGLTWLTPATTSISSSTIAANFGFIQNGNSFGTTATLGTNDAFNLAFETNNSVRITLTQAGRLTFTNVPGNVFLGGGNDTTTGVGNVGVGMLTLASNTIGQNNVANGYAALSANTTGYNNTANGAAALTSNTTGYNNTANGILAMQFNISGTNNVANGASALRFNTGNNNVASGVQAGYNNTSGSDNVIMGMNAFMGNVTGSRNIAIGSSAMINNTSNNNTALGYQAGYSIASGSENTFIGYNTNTASGTITNATALGANVMLAQSNTLILGNNVNVGIGTTTPTTKLHVVKGGSAGVAPHALSFAAFEANTDQYLSLLTPDANERGILFGETSNNTAGGIVYNNPSTPDGFQFRVNGNTTRLVISSSGMVGIGLGFNPGSVLSVNGNAAIGSGGYSDSAAPVNGLIVQGNTGIGTNTPLYLLHVGSASVVSGTTVARFENAGGTCDVTPNVAGGITCTSDQNLKKDIESIDPIDILTRLLTVEVKSYRMNADTSTSTKQTGFLAQQLETQFPGLVLTSIEGTKSVSYAGMTPILTQAIQTLYKFMTDIGVTIEGGVAKIGNFFAKKVTTEELCVGNVCVTESQFLQMVQSTQAASNVVNTELSGENSSDNETINNTPEVSDSNLSEDQINEEGTNQLSGTPLNVETNLSNIEPVVETMSDAVVSTDSIE